MPRATFANVKAAVRAWAVRCRAHPENLLFLFVSSHGESFHRRTAFLLEDYGTDEDDVTAGMSEIEQFIEALSNIDPKQQLLIFDCCRTPTSLGLKFDQQFGTKLINPPPTSGVAPRPPHVLRSTGLGAEAYGRKDKPTLFAEAVLDALRGLAASPNDGWAVNTYGLAHTAARLLGLHMRGGESLQHPEIQLSTPFVISLAPPTNTVTVFVSLAPNYDFSTSRIRMMEGQALIKEVSGAAAEQPFARFELSKNQECAIEALDAAGETIGMTRIDPFPPVAFTELPNPVSVTRSSGARGVREGRGRIVLSAESTDASTLPSIVAILNRRGDVTRSAKAVVLSADGSEMSLEL